MSPYLFILVIESIIIELENAILTKKFGLVKQKGQSKISHLFLQTIYHILEMQT